MRTMDSPMMNQAGNFKILMKVTPRDSPLLGQAAVTGPVSRSTSNGTPGVASPNNPWALPGFSNLPVQQVLFTTLISSNNKF